eukprot:3737735-Rhodomonas_salina.1
MDPTTRTSIIRMMEIRSRPAGLIFHHSGPFQVNSVFSVLTTVRTRVPGYLFGFVAGISGRSSNTSEHAGARETWLVFNTRIHVYPYCDAVRRGRNFKFLARNS